MNTVAISKKLGVSSAIIFPSTPDPGGQKNYEKAMSAYIKEALALFPKDQKRELSESLRKKLIDLQKKIFGKPAI